MSVWHGDITKLEVDVIVNSIHGDEYIKNYDQLRRIATVADSIYKAGGRSLVAEFADLNSKLHGWSALVTEGHQLPAKCNFIAL